MASAASMVLIAAEERARRVAVLRKDIAAGRVTRARAQADELLWFEIEMWARRAAGEPEGSRYGLPADFDALLKTAEATYGAARKANAPEAKWVGLRDLFHWLTLHRMSKLPRAEALAA